MERKYFENQNISGNNYHLPPIDLLNDYKQDDSAVTEEDLIANKNRILDVLDMFKIGVDKISATVGPTVTLYEIVPTNDVKISEINNLREDIEFGFAELGVRIIAPILGRGTIGIEMPNRKPQTVTLRSVIGSKRFQESDFELPVAIGKTIDNETVVFDLAKAPHLILAGAVGQGKTVAINTILMSLLYKKTPEQLKIVLFDPKRMELSPYKLVEKQFLAKLPDDETAIVTDRWKAADTMQSLFLEMNSRYNLIQKSFCRNIKEYNEKFVCGQLDPSNGYGYMPYIVVVIDEFSDLIMTLEKDIEMPVARLAQLGDAVGIHLIIATQRSTNNVLTGLIKANFPSRVVFKVLSNMDSLTVLDASGATQLIGRGDMLISVGCNVLTRVQCAFADAAEIKQVAEYIGSQQVCESTFALPKCETNRVDGEE